MFDRPRRNRVSANVRRLVRESGIRPDNLVLPLFVREGDDAETPIDSMPGQSRLTVDRLVRKCEEVQSLGIPGVALFPVIDDAKKDPHGRESANPEGLLPRAIRAIKQTTPDLVVITDVALDPYSSDGHDGVVVDGRIDNDITLPILARMAVVQAQAGADVVAPSDMMDGRVAAIRDELDEVDLVDTLICSYCAKYASAFYGPFRDALDSAPKSGDKKTYQMDPANAFEALREVRSDENEGADWLMIKPGLPYLDVVKLVSSETELPVAAYHVSGEYSMLKAAAEKGWVDYDACLLESLTALGRSGARILFTYGALDAARLLGG